MAERKKKSTPEYNLLTIMIDDFSAHVSASVNFEVNDPRHCYKDTKVYRFESYLDIKGACTYPEDRAGDTYDMTVYGAKPIHGEFSMTLADCHVRDEKGFMKYRTVRGEKIPIYDVPKGIGHLDRRRGTQTWVGWTWAPSEIISNMLALLPHVRPLFLAIHEIRIGRQRWINSLTLQTTDPEED